MGVFILRRILSGAICGALIGFLIGTYLLVLTADHVIRPDGFIHPLFYERSQLRYARTLVSVFVIVFAAIGPVLAFASFGPWMRDAVYGLVAGIGAVVAVSFVVSVFMDQQPFNRGKMSESTVIDIARIYALPVAILLGPITGVLYGRYVKRGRSLFQDT